MPKFKVAIIVGSLRKDSYNLKLAKALAKLGRERFEFTFLQIGDLPLFNEDLEGNVPPPVTRLKNDIAGADAVLIVTPEYNRGIPGPLKNAIDWASRPYGENSLAGKPGAICGASVGAIGTACAQSSFKSVLSYLDVLLMGSPEVYFQSKDSVIDADGIIADNDTERLLQAFVDRFASWSERHIASGASTP